MISDRTPWQASEDRAVEVLRLDDAEAWVNAMERWAGLDREQLEKMRVAALGYAQRYRQTNEALEQNRSLFRDVFKKTKEVI